MFAHFPWLSVGKRSIASLFQKVPTHSRGIRGNFGTRIRFHAASTQIYTTCGSVFLVFFS